MYDSRNSFLPVELATPWDLMDQMVQANPAIFSTGEGITKGT